MPPLAEPVTPTKPIQITTTHLCCWHPSFVVEVQPYKSLWYLWKVNNIIVDGQWVPIGGHVPAVKAILMEGHVEAIFSVTYCSDYVTQWQPNSQLANLLLF